MANRQGAGGPCARARDGGSRSNNRAAVYLYEKWLPQSGECHSPRNPRDLEWGSSIPRRFSNLLSLRQRRPEGAGRGNDH